LPESDVVKRGLLDLQSIEDCLGLKEGPFFLGQQISLIDITIFAFVAPYLKMDQKLKKAKLFIEINEEKFPKLFALCGAIYSKVVKKEEDLLEGIAQRLTDLEVSKKEIKFEGEKEGEKATVVGDTSKGEFYEGKKEESKLKVADSSDERQKNEDSLEDSSN